MSEIRTAVILAAGYGTRRLPVTKAIEKSMLPIGNRPLIDYAVADCASVGIERIIFVVGEQSEQLRTYYGTNQLLEDYLADKGKTDALKQVRGTSRGLQFEYVVQPGAGKYGTAAGFNAAREALRDVPVFLVMNGDDFTLRSDGESDLRDLMQAWDGPKTHALLTDVIDNDEIWKFGILETENGLLKRVLEKPAAGSTDSRQINKGTYLFANSMLDHLDIYMATDRTEEYYLTDVFQMAVDAGEPISVVQIKGQFMDGGTVEGWLHTNNVIVRGSDNL